MLRGEPPDDGHQPGCRDNGCQRETDETGHAESVAGQTPWRIRNPMPARAGSIMVASIGRHRQPQPT